MNMYDFYDFCEYKSEADEIIESAVSDLKELIKKPIKDKLEKIAEWEEVHEEKERELREKSNSLERQAQKLEKEKEAWEAEKEAKPIEFINNAVKRLCNGLQIGQKVWLVKSYAERVVCPKCNGTGRVNVQYYNGDVVEQQCECCGETVFKYRYRVCEDYVDSIRIAIKFTQQSVYIGTDRDFYQSDQVVYLKENGEAKVKSIFSSPEDAQKEADLRNIRED